MKTSNVLAAVLFGTMAAAAPFDRRAMVTKTQVVVETVVVYTTVYGDDVSYAPATTTAAGLFFEKPQSSDVKPTSTAIYTPPVVVKPSSSAPAPVSSAPAPLSTYVAPAPVSSAAPVVSSAVPVVSSAAPVVSSAAPVVSSAAPVVSSAAPVVSSAAVEAPVTSAAPEPISIYTPAPVPSSTYVTPAPVSSAAAASSSAAASTPSGDKYSGDITIYDNTGADGACGTALYDTDMIVALAADTWGASTYDVMTGAATNKWCGQKIQIEYNGNTVDATIMDLCPGCSGKDIDLSLAVWKKLTGLDEKTRLQANWWTV